VSSPPEKLPAAQPLCVPADSGCLKSSFSAVLQRLQDKQQHLCAYPGTQPISADYLSHPPESIFFSALNVQTGFFSVV